MRPTHWPLGVFGAMAAGLAYASLYEVRAFTLREVTVPVLPAGSSPLRVLHLSDAHMTPGQHRKQQWLRGLAELEPDMVVNTGDNLGHVDALPSVLDAYGDLLDLPGVFVLGSNDYYSPIRKNPVRYLTGGTGMSSGRNDWWLTRKRDLPFGPMRRAFAARGWTDLSNTHATLEVAGRRLAFVGVDDPHLGFDELDEEPADASADLAIGVAHAPYLRVLDRWNTLGYPLIMAGHTHGGQVCLPFYGALVTNCDLDRKRAKGLHTHTAPAPGGRHDSSHDPSWLHVSAGLGTSPFTPVRFACRPEATLLTLTGIDSPGLPT
ncbi:metallophosphoesterase [Aeromicrobium sp.]|uniref:metallophosphoesterase n=1 Tax=Aeromicrobium sp. TaxID=1871063 RepID=UPI003D6ACA2B